jgi:type III pantothenate kinase
MGCSIFPGVGISFDAMHGSTAQLPNVIPDSPARAIGKNSKDALRSGIILGNAMIIDGMCERFAREIRCDLSKTMLVATGEFAERVVPNCKCVFSIDGDITLKGLWYLSENNRKNEI